MLRGQYQLRNELKRIRSDFKTGKATESRLQAFTERVRQSATTRAARLEKVPQASVDEDLPIFEREDEIIAAIQQNQVIVISGETGSGKSTQLPLMALNAGYGIGGLIGHTQPRRIAARGVAARISQQLGTPQGTDVGFKIRFADKTSERTYVKLMTDGILLAETKSDRFLEQYDLIIVDEAHERSLNIDFLLGHLKQILAKRKDLRLIITSATIDTQRFAEHFTLNENSPVPIIAVEGRTFPVEIRYMPMDEKEDPTQGNSSTEIEEHTAQVCRELAGIDDGDMLVFLPTENDIRALNKKLRATRLPGRQTEILPLYARLSTDQQNQIFQPGKARRIVLATNVAESSITVPRIRYVVDTGTARISHYAPRSKVQRLPIQAVSQASAESKGRAVRPNRPRDLCPTLQRRRL